VTPLIANIAGELFQTLGGISATTIIALRAMKSEVSNKVEKYVGAIPTRSPVERLIVPGLSFFIFIFKIFLIFYTPVYRVRLLHFHDGILVV
jgi:hypothetical protein